MIKKITDMVTILGPALIAAAGVISVSGATEVSKGIDIVMIVLGALSSISSIIYNKVTKED